MKNLTINNKGDIIFEGEIIDKKSIDSVFLIKIMQLCLDNQIKMELDDNQYISTLFNKIREECKDETSFHEEWVKNKQIFQNAEDELKKI